MRRLRHLLPIFIFCSTLLGTCAFAQSTLTQIQDTVYTPSASLFNGTAIITWTGSTGSNGSGPVPYNTTVKIYNGALSVLLVPSTATYQVVYNSSDGLVSWTENWLVPASQTPLTLSQVRTTNTGGGGTGTGGTSTSISIDQVTGLSSDLSALNNSLVSLTTLFNNLNSQIENIANSVTALSAQVNGLNSGTTNASFIDAEIPAGAVNGSNSAFTLANAPGTPGSLSLYLNGVLRVPGVDYTLSGSTITFGNYEIPQSGDSLLAYYRVAGTGPLSIFIDDESPSGTIDGTNLSFSLSQSPNPGTSLRLYKNGALLQQVSDYTLNGANITFTSTSVTPQPGDALVAYYRTTSGLNLEGVFAHSAAAGSTSPTR